MSYEVIFKTVIFTDDSGRVILFSRSGCNNDNCGRRPDEFTMKKFNNEADFLSYAEKFQTNGAPIKNGGDFELKINGRPASYYDYGEHLKRIYKRARPASDFEAARCYGKYLKSVYVENTNETLTPEEYDARFWDYIKRFGTVRAISTYNYIYDFSELLSLDEKTTQDTLFYIK